MGVIRYSCGFLFVSFCFCYLYFLRGDVLAQVQHVLSNGLTSYSVTVGAIIITFLLAILQWVVDKFVRLPDKYYAVTYIPSFIALAMLIDMDQNMDGEFVWGVWKWLMPLLLFVWVFLIVLIKEMYRAVDTIQATLQSQLKVNYLILLCLIIATGSVSSTPAVEQYVLKTERMLLSKDYESAAGVGVKSLDANARLTQLRMYALSKQGLLADSMFSYPQNFGSKGLLDIHDTVKSNRFPMQNIEFYLGAFCGNTIRSTRRYLERLAIEDSVLHTSQSEQYLMCFHLLNKDINEFNKVLHHVYGDTITATLPRAYQEAIIMQHEYTPDSLPIYINKEYVERYESYKSLRVTLLDDKERRNLTRREYGNTYWWYFEN